MGKGGDSMLWPVVAMLEFAALIVLVVMSPLGEKIDWAAMGAVGTFLAVLAALWLGLRDQRRQEAERRNSATFTLSRLDGRLWEAIQMLTVASGVAAQMPRPDVVKLGDCDGVVASLSIIVARLDVALRLVSEESLLDAFAIFRKEATEFIRLSAQVHSVFQLFQMHLSDLEKGRALASLSGACKIAHGIFLSGTLTQLVEVRKNFELCLENA